MLSACWLQAESIGFFYRYTKTRQFLLDELARELNVVVERENRRFGRTRQQAQWLNHLWTTLQDQPLSDTGTPLSRRTVFVPFHSAVPNQIQVRQARRVVALFGDADPPRRTGAFLLLPGQGLVLYEPDPRAQGGAPCDRPPPQLQRQPSGTGVPRWSQPFRDARGRLCLTVAYRQTATGILAGQSLAVGSLTPAGGTQRGHLLVLRRVQDGPAVADGLTSEAPALLRNQLPPRCERTFAARIGDFRTTCRALADPDWEVVGLFSGPALARQTLALLGGPALPFVLMAQLVSFILTGVTLWQLWRPHTTPRDRPPAPPGVAPRQPAPRGTPRRTPSSPARASEPPPPVASPWSLSVLLVDDVSLNRDIVARMLSGLGHRTETVPTGSDALKRGRQQVFDLVLMDVHMPGLDGLETTRCWRDPAAGLLDPDTPVIALTADGRPIGRALALQAGMNGCLTKPVGLAQLSGAIDLAISLQLERGIDLAPNPALLHPLLDAADPAVGRALLAGYARIRVDWRSQERQRLLGSLHALKGCAGQTGMARIQTCVERLETRVRQGGWPSRRAIRALGRVIRSVNP